ARWVGVRHPAARPPPAGRPRYQAPGQARVALSQPAAIARSLPSPLPQQTAHGPEAAASPSQHEPAPLSVVEVAPQQEDHGQPPAPARVGTGAGPGACVITIHGCEPVEEAINLADALRGLRV